MSTHMRVVLAIGACVAALLTTSCSAKTSNSSEPNGMPSFTSKTPEGFDRWKRMSSGDTLEEMTAMAPIFGVKAINIPNKEYLDKGTVGVAQLEDFCVLGFNEAPSSESGDPLLDMTLMSRYNSAYIVVMPNLTVENVPKMVEKYRSVCTGESELLVEGSINQSQNT